MIVTRRNEKFHLHASLCGIDAIKQRVAVHFTGRGPCPSLGG